MVKHSSGRVEHPGDDKRVEDAERFVHDRRLEAEAMIRLWTRSTKPYAGDELRYWRSTLRQIELQAAKLLQRDENR
jgi:hypothetical protein